MPMVSAKVRVQVVLDIELTDKWDDKATVGQVHEYAKQAARGQLDHLLEAKAKGSTRGEFVVPDPSVYQRIRVINVKTFSVSTEVE